MRSIAAPLKFGGVAGSRVTGFVGPDRRRVDGDAKQGSGCGRGRRCVATPPWASYIADETGQPARVEPCLDARLQTAAHGNHTNG